jgi:hypothetical protein
MIPFVIKSAICLIVLYGFYHFFLRNIKVFDFNRFYLLFSLLFALVIPLITIQVKLDLPVDSNFQGLSNITGSFIQAEEITANPIHNLTFLDLLVVVYSIVSTILLVRFAINIYKIIRLIRISSIVPNLNTKLVLIDKKTLPYSFFRYIFVNRLDYENGKIEKELIIHEQTHCLYYHSVDILLIELFNIILWFNPLLWLFRKAIQLNHEFIADNEVLTNHGLNDYQNTLLNLVFRNNSTYLASSFNYSLTKKRLIMMTKNNSLNKAIYRKIAAIPLFLILTITLTFSQETKQKVNTMNFENEWWYPILIKHNKVPSAFNNFRNIFEMGENNSINDGVCTLTNAYVIIRDSIDNYIIIESPLLYHDFNKELLITNSGTMKMYKKDSLVPYTVIEITKLELHALKN